jgi:Fe-S-cluster-containing dehydrogenase component
MRLSVIDVERCTGCRICMFACTRRLGYAGLGKTAIHIKSVGGIYTPELTLRVFETPAVVSGFDEAYMRRAIAFAANQLASPRA